MCCRIQRNVTCNVKPLLFQTGIRTVKKLVLTLAIHDKNVMTKTARANFTVRTGLALPLERKNETQNSQIQ